MYCRFCGLLIPDDSRFCKRCGQRVDEPAATAQPNQALQSPNVVARQEHVVPQEPVNGTGLPLNTVEMQNIYCSFRIEKKNALKKLNLLGTEKGYFTISGDYLHFTRIPVAAQTLFGAVGGATAGVAGALAAGVAGNNLFAAKSFLVLSKAQILSFSVETLFKTNYLVIRFEGKEIALTCKNPAFDSLYNWLRS